MAYNPDLPRVPHMEDSPRRHDRRHLDLRLQDGKDRGHHEDNPPRTSSRCGPQATGSTSSRTGQEAEPATPPHDLATKATDQLTDFKDFDIKFPSLGGGVIVRGGGYIGRRSIQERAPPEDPDHREGRLRRSPGARQCLQVRGRRITMESVVVNARGTAFTVPEVRTDAHSRQNRACTSCGLGLVARRQVDQRISPARKTARTRSTSGRRTVRASRSR